MESLPLFLPATSLVALSQAVKDGSSLVVTPSSIPSFATRGPNVDFSFDEESKEAFEDPDDEPVVRTRISDSDEASDDEHRVENMGMYPLFLQCLLFLLFLSPFSAFLYLLRMLFLPCSHGHA